MLLKFLKVCKELRATKCEGVLINQFIRSGTSIGANIREVFITELKNKVVSSGNR
ncbi:MAG: four helix bundle protein [Ruminococcaceae bacterium]|nr:four helix bundle protein [Oscillospiraceae bacterium]